MSLYKLPFRSQEEVDEFFKMYDKNGDGVITKEELLEGPMVGSKAHQEPKNQPKPKPNKVSSNILHVEPKKKLEDKAQKAPARALQRKNSSLRYLSREQMKEIFREHDIDGDGFLDFGELTRAFGFLDSILPFYKARNGLTCADANGDGLIGEDELDELVNFAEKLYKK